MAGARRVLAIVGTLLVVATGVFLLAVVRDQGGLAPSSLYLVALPVAAIFALREAWSGRPLGAVLALGLAVATSVLVFSQAILFFFGFFLMLAGAAPPEPWLTPRRAALAVAVAGLAAPAPVLADIGAMALDPCGTVHVEPWGATSGGGSSSPGGACPAVRGTSVTLDRLVALTALAAAGALAAVAAALRGPRPAVGAAALPLLVALVAGAASGGGIVLAQTALACLAVLAWGLRRWPRPDGTGPGPTDRAT